MRASVVTPFHVEITLKSGGVSAPRGILLDGLLAAVLYGRTGDAEEAWERLPLARTGSTVHASLGMVLRRPTMRTDVVYAGLRLSDRTDGSIGPNRQEPGKRAGILPKIDPGTGRYRTVASEILLHDVPSLHFLGLGDVEAVRDLLGEVLSIGARHAAGCGAVGEVRIEAIAAGARAAARTDFGVRLADGTPIRPVPLADWPAIAGTPVSPGLRVDRVSWRVPRWKPENEADCVIPTEWLPVVDARKLGAELAPVRPRDLEGHLRGRQTPS